MVAAVFATAGLLGAAAFGVSELASADDDPGLTAPDDTVAGDDESSPDDDGTEQDSGESDDAPSDGSDGGSMFEADGELRLDLGDGEPIIIDLDDIDAESLDELTECIGLPGFDFDKGLPGLDPEQFDQFFEDFDPEQLEGQLDEMFGEFDFDKGLPGLDPEQFDQFFEDFDPEQLEQELGPLFEGQFGDLFDQFFEGFDPELFEQFFDEMAPFGEEFGEHEAGHRAIERPLAPDFSLGSWFPSGLDREKIESCLAELD